MKKIMEYLGLFSFDGFPPPFHWFHIEWWRYLFEGDVFTREEVHWWTIVACRARNHPHRKYVYDNNYEPMEVCSNCGEDWS